LQEAGTNGRIEGERIVLLSKLACRQVGGHDFTEGHIIKKKLVLGRTAGSSVRGILASVKSNQCNVVRAFERNEKKISQQNEKKPENIIKNRTGIDSGGRRRQESRF